VTSEPWQRVKSLFERALDQPAAARDAFLQQATESPSVLAEVRKLISGDAQAGEFMQHAEWPESSAAPPLSPGDLVSGHYRIVNVLGRGGMGVVYRSEDLSLSRPVALKFLPGRLETLQAMGRLKREARAAAGLNHPNICVVYETGEHHGQPFIAMELLEGQTLKQRVGTGPLKTDELLEWAIAIADGLEAAHRASIVHRDIKPANIFITARGQPKILDFGLAKVTSQVSGETGDDLSTPGVAIGTVPYMSPEQARGEALDSRTDLFSFGAVLYEMATGKAAFTGATTGIVHEAILERESSPASAVNPRIPRELDSIIGKALEKDRDLRYQHAAEMRADLKRVKRDIDSGRTTTAVKQQPRSHHRMWAFGAVAAGLIAAAFSYQVWKRTSLFQTSLSHIEQPRYRQITFTGNVAFPTISPDGKFVAYVTGKQSQGQRLMLQDVTGGQAIEISKARFLMPPRWSPDGSELAIMRQIDDLHWGVFLVPRLGGSPRAIANGSFNCWSPDGTQIATAFRSDIGFLITDKATGKGKSTTMKGFRYFMGCDWSGPSNRLAVLATLENGKRAIWTVRPDGSQQRKVIEEDGLDSPCWSPDGDAIYFIRINQAHNSDLEKVTVDRESGQATGSAVLLSGLQAGDYQLMSCCYLTMSADGGHLAYSKVQDDSILWLARFQSVVDGRKTGQQPRKSALTGGTSKSDSPSISPDGQWIAFVSNGHVHKMPAQGGTPTQLTFSNTSEFSPAWSSDSKKIAFGSNEGGAYKVWIVDADGSNTRQFAKTQLNGDKIGNLQSITWAPGPNILYQKEGKRNFSILDPETGDEQPLIRNEPDGWLFAARYSPDGKKVAVHWNRERAPNGLWVISLVDHSETFLHPGICFPAGWSSNARLYAFCGSDMLSIPAAPGAPQRTIFSIPEEISSASVSPDGKKFVYAARDQKSDVWLIDNFDPAYRKN